MYLQVFSYHKYILLSDINYKSWKINIILCFSSSVYSTILLALPIAPLWSATDSDACPVVTIGWQDSSSDCVEVRRGSAVLEFLSFGFETFPTDQF